MLLIWQGRGQLSFSEGLQMGCDADLSPWVGKTPLMVMTPVCPGLRSDAAEQTRAEISKMGCRTQRLLSANNPLEVKEVLERFIVLFMLPLQSLFFLLEVQLRMKWNDETNFPNTHITILQLQKFSVCA